MVRACQDILRLEIAVENAFVVEVRHAVRDFCVCNQPSKPGVLVD